MEVIKSSKAPGALGPYSQATIAGGFVFVSGQLGIDPVTGKFGENVKEEARQSIKNISNILKEVGLDLSDIVKATVFLDDLNDFDSVNTIYQESFKEPYPARSCIEVAKLPKEAKVEIEVIAKLRD